MREEISCTGDKEAIHLEGSLLHNHKLLLSGIKCLAVNQKFKSKTHSACRKVFELIDASAISSHGERRCICTALCRTFQGFFVSY